MKTEQGGKTLAGRETRNWYVGQRSNVNGRKCEVMRFSKGAEMARVLVRWLEPCVKYDSRTIPGNVGEGRTQWVGRYQVEPEYGIE